MTAEGENGESTPLEGITVKLSSTASPGSFLTALTDSAGYYQFDRLSAGKYGLAVHVVGFQSVAESVVLGQFEPRVEKVALHIERVVQKVEVHDQASVS